MNGKLSRRSCAVRAVVAAAAVLAVVGVVIAAPWRSDGGAKAAARVLGDAFERATAAVPGHGRGSAPAAKHPHFTMTSRLVRKLVPGAKRSLWVHVHNPNGQRLQVTRVSVEVQKPDKVGCPVRWVTAEHYQWAEGDPKFYVKAHHTRSVLLHLRLINLPTTNQDACIGATFPLKFAGLGQVP